MAPAKPSDDSSSGPKYVGVREAASPGTTGRGDSVGSADTLRDCTGSVGKMSSPSGDTDKDGISVSVGNGDFSAFCARGTLATDPATVIVGSGDAETLLGLGVLDKEGMGVREGSFSALIFLTGLDRVGFFAGLEEVYSEFNISWMLSGLGTGQDGTAEYVCALRVDFASFTCSFPDASVDTMGVRVAVMLGRGMSDEEGKAVKEGSSKVLIFLPGLDETVSFVGLEDFRSFSGRGSLETDGRVVIVGSRDLSIALGLGDPDMEGMAVNVGISQLVVFFSLFGVL